MLSTATPFLIGMVPAPVLVALSAWLDSRRRRRQ